METKTLFPAAQYVRMSTEDQQYSIVRDLHSWEVELAYSDKRYDYEKGREIRQEGRREGR